MGRLRTIPLKDALKVHGFHLGELIIADIPPWEIDIRINGKITNENRTVNDLTPSLYGYWLVDSTNHEGYIKTDKAFKHTYIGILDTEDPKVTDSIEFRIKPEAWSRHPHGTISIRYAWIQTEHVGNGVYFAAKHNGHLVGRHFNHSGDIGLLENGRDLSEWTERVQSSLTYIDENGKVIATPTYVLPDGYEEDTEWTIIGAPEHEQETTQEKYGRHYEQHWVSGTIIEEARTCIVTPIGPVDNPAQTCVGEDGTHYVDSVSEIKTESTPATKGERVVSQIDTIPGGVVFNPNFIDIEDVASWNNWFETGFQYIDDVNNPIDTPTFTLNTYSDDEEWTILDAPEHEQETKQQKYRNHFIDTWNSGTMIEETRDCSVIVERALDDPAKTCTGEDGTLYADGASEIKTTTIDAELAKSDPNGTEVIAEETIDNPSFIDLEDIA